MPKLQNAYLQVATLELCSEAFAKAEDAKDPLSKLREEFWIPTKGDLRNKKFGHQKHPTRNDDGEDSIYLCGNSLGLQPRRTKEYVNRYMDTWASKGVFGHFTDYEGGLPPWLHIDDVVKEQTAKIVGALSSEVVVMETLTANLHLLMASFYKPSKDRWKIIIEGKAFPSDHYAALSQIAHHNLDPSALITIDPPSSSSPYLSTEHILSIISQHAATTALVLLPGIQFYSGQYFDIELITRHCHALGITVGWDLAHATGNVPLKLHDWNVDFAAWCNYKYMNGGPGVIGGLFVHERHGTVEKPSTTPRNPNTSKDSRNQSTELIYRPRLSGWWGSDKSSRFAMSNTFIPIPGASGYQLSNPSALDITSVMASLDVFSLTSIDALRQRSLRLTGYLEARLLRYPGGNPPYTIITPANPAERGAQLSVLLQPGLLEQVQRDIEDKGVVVDERKPDVLRITPAPLYNSFLDVHRFMEVFHEACRKAVEGSGKAKTGKGGVASDGIART
ncbi:Kynureninase 1 [Plenodomus lingam]|uniref:Kynureninase n=1 Tax=Leptosphaeria maculans (strain JN3 / isolate v23.1.3 / race Av1-4-5-6-7-8) TaxID=985895 RepID=E5A8R0_LEPMJ|nr:similar to kynureninase [Plenodomus lingam JN3]KAH9877416.1 Kynureninase 1 [Plenodomus lingam]CBY00005.1 similar to kynureninase [Plenodomus lingam JN3]